MSQSKSIKTNTVLNIIKTCTTILYPLITFPYVLRILLPTNIGKVDFAQAFVSYFSLIAMLGISTHAIRVCAAVRNDKRQLSDIASQILSINLCSSAFAYLLLFLSLLFFRKYDQYRLLIIIESTTILFTALGADWLNSAMEDFQYITIRTVVSQLIALVATFLFVRTEDDYPVYAIICVFGSSAAQIINIFYRKRYCDIHLTLRIQWSAHLKPILFLFVMTLSQVILSNTDITMLGLIKGDFAVGIYSTAHKVTRVIGQVVQSVAIVIIPRLSLYFASNDFTSANKLLRKVLNFNLTLGLPCVVGVEMIAEDIIFLAGGAEFASAAPVIRVLILSFMFSLVGGSFLGNAVLIPMKQEKYYMIVCIITACVNIVLNALLIPVLSTIGASIATAINGFLIFILLLFKVDKRIQIPSVRTLFISPLIGCLGIVICCLCSSLISLLSVRVIVSLFSSILVYGCILLALHNDLAIELLSTFKHRIHKTHQ